jgi:YbgC/YbaW family acyl-CoA thioester hydrolase
MTVGRGRVERTIAAHCCTEILQRVGVADTDMMGIVHHANYVVYFERGRLEYMRRRGLSYKQMVERGYHMPVVELNVRYRKPAHFDDMLRVETRRAEPRHRPFRLPHQPATPGSGGRRLTAAGPAARRPYLARMRRRRAPPAPFAGGHRANAVSSRELAERGPAHSW